MYRPRLLFVLVGLLCAFAWAYAEIFSSLVEDWGLNDDYSHGFLVIPVSLYLAYERRASLIAAARRPSWGGLVVLAAGLAMLAVGTFSSQFLARLSIVATVLGTTMFVFGREHARILLFPIGFLLLMIPPPGVLYNQFAFSLQLIASSFGEAVLTTAGVPVFREGNVLALPHISLNVAEACSGIRSLMSLGTMTLLYGYYSVPAMPARVLLVAATLPLAIVTNGLRVAATGLVAHYYGEAAALGFFHTFSGLLVFATAFGALVLLRRAAVWAVNVGALARVRTPHVQPW
jgi:exosortase